MVAVHCGCDLFPSVLISEDVLFFIKKLFKQRENVAKPVDSYSNHDDNGWLFVMTDAPMLCLNPQFHLYYAAFTLWRYVDHTDITNRFCNRISSQFNVCTPSESDKFCTVNQN